MPVKMEGIKDLKRILKNADVKIRIVANKEMLHIANDLLNEAGALAPFKEGILEGSGTLSGMGPVTGPIIKLTVAFGGPAAPYALIQHEGVDPRTGKLYFHPAKADGGMGPGIPGQDRARKYLEEPAKRHQATVVPRLIAAIKTVT
jgi:hypothetical protein